MGLLDRWSKKKTEEKLSASAPKAVAKKSIVKKDEGKAPVKKDDAKQEADKEIVGKVGGIAYRILVRPLVTEKAAVAESVNKYTFVVAPYATKSQVIEAVAEAYGVRPVSVNIMNVEGRRVRFGRSRGKRSDYRKAIVTLPSGKIINIHEGV